jgi:uncharacterized SAM-binding protein YcdF (DUF218 family)
LFYFLSKILDVFLTPLAWSAALVVVGITRRSFAWKGRLWAAAGALVLVAFSLEPVSNLLWRRLEIPAEETFRPDVTYDVVVLLGGVVEDRAQASSGQRSFNDNNERLLETFDLLRKGTVHSAIVSGGLVDAIRKEVVEADALAEQLTAWGIDPSRIIVEDKARNTYENAKNSEAIVRAHGWHDVLIVTSAFHMQRAYGCFRAVGLEVDTLPVDFRSYASPYSGELLPRAKYLADSTTAIREWSGRWIYRVRGYSK